MALSAADQLVRARFASFNLPESYWGMVPKYGAKEGNSEGDWYDSWVPMVNQQYLLDQQQGALQTSQAALEQANQALSAEFLTVTGQSPAGNPNALDSHFVVDAAGTANAYVITRSPAQTDPLLDKQMFVVRWPEANTGAATLQIDGLAPVDIELEGAALSGGELDQLPTLLIFNGTSFQIANGASSAGAPAAPQITPAEIANPVGTAIRSFSPKNVADMSAASAPIFQTPTLVSPWVNYGASDQAARYYRNSENRVYIEGSVKGGASTSVVFVLPTGYRPQSKQYFPILSSSNLARLMVLSSGEVYFLGTAGSLVSMAGVSFLAGL